MKKMTFKIYMAACCAALAFSACSEEDATRHGVAPAKIGTISLNTGKDQVRPGQPLTASIALPTGGQNISEETYTWGSLNYPSEKEENGTAYFSFTAPEEPGQYSLSFNARYSFLGPDAEGNFYKDMSSTLDYTVISCDIFSSFWDDDLATTLKVYPRLTESTSQPGTYLGTFADKLSSSSFSTINRAFTFNDNILSKITEYEIYTNTNVSTYARKFYVVRTYAQRRFNMEVETEYYDDASTPDLHTPIAEEDWNDENWKNEMGQKLQAGTLRLYCKLQDEHTQLWLSAFDTGDGSGIYLVRDYTANTVR